MSPLLFSDEELSRFIAEKLEPSPQFRTDILDGGPISSNGRCWVISASRKGEDLHASDMVSDPAMTVMLLELPGFVDLCFVDEDGLYDVTFCGEEVHTLECGAKMKTAQHAKLGRAVAEAFAISHGWVEA